MPKQTHNLSDLAVVPHHEMGGVLASYWHLPSLANLLNLTSVLICVSVVFSISTCLALACLSFKELKDAAQLKIGFAIYCQGSFSSSMQVIIPMSSKIFRSLLKSKGKIAFCEMNA